MMAWITTALAMLTFVGTAVGMVIKMSWVVRDEIAKFSERYDKQLEVHKLDIEAKMGVMWKRFDTHKSYTDETYVRSQTCSMIQNGKDHQFDNLNRQMESMEKKIDALMMKLLEK